MVGQPPSGEALSRGRRRLLLLAASALLAGGAAVLILTRHRLLSALPAAGAAAALLGAAFGARAEGVDWMVDAEVAPTQRAERFLTGVTDRLFDACVLVPLAWVARSGSNVDAFLALVGLGASYLASYQRARGEALGYRGSESVAYRATRYATLVLGLLTGWLDAALWAFCVVAVAAAAVRGWNVVVQERRSPSGEEAPA